MPLILLSGFPSSGKTYRSQQLVEFLDQKIAESRRPLTVHHLDDQGLGLSRDVYATARAEKDARATLSSAIKRLLARDTLVVADGMNYIKGFRYQLYCEAKAVQTPSCVVHVGTPVERCRALNAAALHAGTGGYDPAVFDDLIFRYEEPDGRNRWDAPLFTVLPDDAAPPGPAIWDALVGPDGAPRLVRPHAATVLQPAAAPDHLYELDRATSDVLAALGAWLQDHPGEGGGQVIVPPAAAHLVVTLPVDAPALPRLQRLRRQFIALHRQHALGKERIRELFVDYLNDAFQT